MEFMKKIITINGAIQRAGMITAYGSSHQTTL